MKPIATVSEFLSRIGQDAPTNAEYNFIRDLRSGQPCILGDGTRPNGPSPERTVRAELLRTMISGGTSDCQTRFSGIRLVGAFIPDILNLDYMQAKGITSFECCTFACCVSATQSELQFLNISGCYLPRLSAQRSNIAGNLFLQADGGTVLEIPGGIDIAGANIGGQLACRGATLGNGRDHALNAQGINVSDSVFLTVSRCGLPFISQGEVSFSGATVGGQFAGTGGKFRSNDGLALNAERARIRGGVYLHATDTKTRFVADGEVVLRDAEIGGQLACGGGLFRNPKGRTFTAEGAQVSGSVYLHAISDELRFESLGQVSLAGCCVKGQVVCRGGRFQNGTKFALSLERAEIGGNVDLSALSDRTRFEAQGDVRLVGAVLQSDISLSGAQLENEDGYAFNADQLSATRDLFWRNVVCDKGIISLGSAQVGGLADDLECWPNDHRLFLNGFVYERIHSFANDVDDRLLWLARGLRPNDEFLPQPYLQLARVLFRQGNRSGARKVQMERERQTRLSQLRISNGDLGIRRLVVVPILWLWSQLLRLVTGYGYAPWRALYVLFATWIVTVCLTELSWREGGFAPNSGVILVSEAWQRIDAVDCHGGFPVGDCVPNPAETWSSRGGAGMDWDSFNRYGYAADLVLPVLSLGQTDAWAPSKDRGPYSHLLWWGRWVISGVGWIIALLAAATVTGVIRKEEEGV